jgi:hypothetical protein
MVPFGLNEDRFCARYMRELERSSPATIAALRELIARQVEAGVSAAHFEIFLGEDGSAPSVWAYYRGENNKVDRSDPRLFAGRSLDLELPLSKLSEFDERYFGEDFRGNYLSANLLKAWFAEMWWKAGGWMYTVPASLKVHDDLGDGSVLQLTEAAA